MSNEENEGVWIDFAKSLVTDLVLSAMESPHASDAKMTGLSVQLEVAKRQSSSNCLEGV